MQLVVVRGDHRVNEIKLAERPRAGRSAPRAPTRSRSGSGRPGYIGPVGAQLPILLDAAVAADATGAYVAGANRARRAPARRRSPAATSPFETVDVRTVVAGDTVNGARSGSSRRSRSATSSSSAPATPSRWAPPTSTSPAQSQLDLDGLLRVRAGPRRRGRGRAVRRRAGISWPRAIAPFDVELVALGKPGSEERALADRLYEELQAAGLDTLYDDRDAGPGEKFADAELLGCPVRLTVGRRTLAAGEIEVQIRRGRESRVRSRSSGAAAAVAELCGASCPEATRRRRRCHRCAEPGGAGS